MYEYVSDRFRVNIFLDTNILIDIIDKSYENLNHVLNFCKTSNFVTLKSSHYVMFEMVENRKWAHFSSIVTNLDREIDLSKKKYNWDINGINYLDHKSGIKKKVLEEKKQIFDDFTIVWEENVLHNQLLEPTLDLCLESTISREDSLVLLSAVYPKENQKEDQVLLVSRDIDFKRSYDRSDIDDIFSRHELNKPEMIQTESLTCVTHPRIINLNARDHHSKEEVENYWKIKLCEIIIEKNTDTFLGYTYSNTSVKGENCIFFKLDKNKKLYSGIGLVLIGKDLDFVYSTNIISEFWNNSVIDSYPFLDESNQSNISFKPYDKNENGDIIEFQDKELLSKIRKKGNLVFINKDTN